jgi:hypothetical protein
MPKLSAVEFEPLRADVSQSLEHAPHGSIMVGALSSQPVQDGGLKRRGRLRLLGLRGESIGVTRWARSGRYWDVACSERIGGRPEMG